MIKLVDTKANELEILNLMLRDKDSRLSAINNLKDDCFSTSLNKRLFKTIEVMERNMEEIDLVLVIQKMEQLGLREEGDITAITEIYNELSSTVTLKSHIEKLIEGYRSNEFKRKMCSYVTTDDLLDTDGVINSLSKIIENRRDEESSVLNLQEWLLKEVGERLGLERPKPLGILTGYRDLDKILKGIVPGSLVTLLARSGVGKTTFSIDLVKKIASRTKAIAYFSLEMPPEQIYLKMVLTEANLRINDYISITRNSESEASKLAIASTKISALNLKFSQEREVKKIVNLINFYVRKENIKIFFIDYLNIVSSDNKTSNTDILYNEITAELKQVALKTESIIFLITQSSRVVDSQQDKRPNLKDIKSSSSIEQNSDYIVALYRNLDFNNPSKRNELFNEGKLNYKVPNADKNPDCFEVIVLKNRHTGECGTAYLKYSSCHGYLNWQY